MDIIPQPQYKDDAGSSGSGSDQGLNDVDLMGQRSEEEEDEEEAESDGDRLWGAAQTGENGEDAQYSDSDSDEGLWIKN